MVGATVLIVEDEDVVAENVADTLEDSGYVLAGRATTGEDAVRLCRDEAPDVVLMDINLEGSTDGIAAASEIRSSMGVPVIFLTSLADDETFARAKITEPQGYVLKPFKEFELRTALELAILRSRHRRDGGQHPAEQAEPTRAQPVEAPTAREFDLSKLSPEFQSLFERVRNFETFKSFDDAMLYELLKDATVAKFKAQQTISFEGDAAHYGILVLSGRVALLKSSSSGKELIVELLPPGDPFALFSAIQDKNSSTGIKAQIPSEVLRVPRSNIATLLDRHPELSRTLVGEVFARLRRAHDLSRALAHDRVEVRIAAALSALVPRFSAAKDDHGREIFTIEMTRQELSELIGSTAETVIRVTKAFERDGLLQLDESKVIKICDLPQLKEIAENV